VKLPHIRILVLCVWLALCAIGGSIISWLSGMSFLGGAAIVASALFINGVVAEIEDRWPGGFLNPRGKAK